MSNVQGPVNSSAYQESVVHEPEAGKVRQMLA